jgi:hypothetical protein
MSIMRSGILAVALAGCSFGPAGGAIDGPLPPEDASSDAPGDAPGDPDAPIPDAGPLEPDAPPPPPACPDDASLLVCFSFDTALTPVVQNEGTAAAADATLVNVTAAMRGTRGAVQLSGESSITVPPATGVVGVLTFETWVNLDAQPTGTARFGIVDVTSTAPISIFYNREGSRAFLRFDMGPVIDVDGELPLGVWTHLAMVCDGNRLRVYLDGEEASNAVGCAAANGTVNGVYIGRNNETPIVARAPDRTLGKLDDVRMWTRALTAQEISDRASASAARR